MPSGYLVDLGNTILDSGDGITLSYRQFTTDSVIGVGTWVWSGSKGKTTYTDVEETGVYYLAANGSVYFVPDGGRVNHADTATTGTVPSYIQSDGIISGTTSADVIDSNYSDQDGDSVDLGFGSGPNGFGDSIEAGAGDDTISAGQGNDTIFGQAGADVIDGGAGNDTIYGQDGADDLSGGDGDDEIHGGSAPVSAASEFLSWSSEGADDTDISSGFTQNTGTMNVTINFADSGNALAMQVESVDTTYVASGESFDPNSNLFLAGSGSGDTVITTLTFDADPSGGMTDEVENVSFRLNDIDAASGSWQDIISISALDADGNAVGVTITADGNDLVSGDTITGAESTDSEASVDGSALVTIAGPVHSVSIVYANGQTSTQTLWVSDVHFDTIPGAGDTSGNTLSGDAGAVTLYGGAGDDTLTGGTEADSLYGGSGDDAFYLAQGDSAWGGLGDDVFVISDTGETNTTTITIDGEEDSASIGDTLDLNKLVDRNTLSYTDDGTGSYSGTAQLFSGATLNFSNIENIICFTPGTMIETARGPIAVEDMNEGLSDYLDSKGYKSVADFSGAAVKSLSDWKYLDLHYKRVARIDYDKCIGCNLCYIACEDGAHQCIDLVDSAPYGLGPGRVPGKPVPKVREEDCVGCNLCSIVCPVDDCITMVEIETGREKMSWDDYQTRLAKGEMEPIPAHP